MSHHCWHWTGADAFGNAERSCCWCGYKDLAQPGDGKTPGHGPMIPGGDANGPVSKAGYDGHDCPMRPA